MKDIKEKEVKELSFTNIDITKLDVAKLDTEHVYVFKFPIEYSRKTSFNAITTQLNNIKKKLDEWNIKYIIIVDDFFTITELVSSKEELENGKEKEKD